MSAGRSATCIWRDRAFDTAGRDLYLLHYRTVALAPRHNAAAAARSPHPEGVGAMEAGAVEMVPSIVLIFLVLAQSSWDLQLRRKQARWRGRGDCSRRDAWPAHVAAGARGHVIDDADHVDGDFHLIGSTVFSLVFQGMDGSRWIEHMLTGLPAARPASWSLSISSSFRLSRRRHAPHRQRRRSRRRRATAQRSAAPPRA